MKTTAIDKKKPQSDCHNHANQTNRKKAFLDNSRSNLKTGKLSRPTNKELHKQLIDAYYNKAIRTLQEKIEKANLECVMLTKELERLETLNAFVNENN